MFLYEVYYGARNEIMIERKTPGGGNKVCMCVCVCVCVYVYLCVYVCVCVCVQV